MKSQLYFFLILVAFAVGEKPIVSANGESRFQWRSLDSTTTSRPEFTLIPPEWHDEAKVDIPDLGIIQGDANLTFPLMALSTRRFFRFAGIPYADPASYTMDKRFQPSKIWEGKLPVDENGTFPAKDFSVKCPQPGGDEALMSVPEILGGDITGIKRAATEECLVLNINTPSLPTGGNPKLLPVIVFIHGGGYETRWSGQFQGHLFLKKDVVFVSINYRLGLLGSLNLGIDGAPGNAALYDVVTALKWIKRYIAYFGGDKDKITVSGSSAGGVLASHFLTSDLAIDTDGKPLLHGIIGLSGSTLSQTLATCTHPLKHHLLASQFAGCYNEGTEPNFQQIRDCMAQKTPDELVEALNKYTDSEMYEGRFAFGAKSPSLQDQSKLSIPAFIKETPYAVLKHGDYKLDAPIMMGVTRHDGSFLVTQELDKFWAPHNYTNDPLFLRNHLLPTLMESLDLTDDSGELIHSLENTYIGEAMHTDDFEAKIPGLIDIFSVLFFKAGAYNMVELNAKRNPSYYFSYEHNGLCSVDNGPIIPGGVGHMDSLFPLFPFSDCALILPGDLSVSSSFIDYWTNFATYGNPNGKGKTTTASPYNPLNHAYLVIDGMERTEYYCRDGWIDNSLELMNPTPTLPPISWPTGLPTGWPTGWPTLWTTTQGSSTNDGATGTTPGSSTNDGATGTTPGSSTNDGVTGTTQGGSTNDGVTGTTQGGSTNDEGTGSTGITSQPTTRGGPKDSGAGTIVNNVHALVMICILGYIINAK